MSKLKAHISTTARPGRLRTLVIVAAASLSLGACASGGLGSLTAPSLAPADKPMEESRSAAAQPSVAATAAPAVAAKPVSIYLDDFKGGVPAATGNKLKQKMQDALAARNANVVRMGALYRIKGTVSAFSDKKNTVVAYVWDVTRGGKVLKRVSGEASVAGSGNAWKDVDDKTMQKIVDAGAGEMADWMIADSGGNVAVASAAGGGRLQANRVSTTNGARVLTSRPAPRDMLVLVTDVSGAPGDGEQSLTSAMRNSLRAKGIKLTSKASDAVYQIRGLVEVGAASSGKQPVKIDWRIYAPNGKRLKHVVQNNKLPAGSLNGAWGPIATMAADGAADDIVLVLNRATAQM